MARPCKTVINVLTGKCEEVELTDAELEQVAKDKAEWDARYAARLAEELRTKELEALKLKALAERTDAPQWLKDQVATQAIRTR